MRQQRLTNHRAVKRGRPPKNREKNPLLESSAKLSKVADHMKVTFASGDAMKDNSKKRKRSSSSEFCDVKKRANQVQEYLMPEFPSLIKCMLQSHVIRGFWLGLPKKFCDLHMPKHDAKFILEDENGEEYEVNYLSEKRGLSGGWKGFSIAHNLSVGDAALFQLVAPSKFKVYIIRSHSSDEVGAPFSLPNLDAGNSERDIGEENDKIPEREPPTRNSSEDNSFPVAALLENDCGDPSSGIHDAITVSGRKLDFKEMNSIDDFNVVVNGEIINSMLPEDVRVKYYRLCCNQVSFLHEHIIKDFNQQLVSGMIQEIVRIVDSITASNLNTPHGEYVTWDEILDSFEGLGMNVAFIRDRLNQLAELSLNSKKYNEARDERARVEKELRYLEAKISEIKERRKKVEIEIESLGVNESGNNFENLYSGMAKAPW